MWPVTFPYSVFRFFSSVIRFLHHWFWCFLLLLVLSTCCLYAHVFYLIQLLCQIILVPTWCLNCHVMFYDTIHCLWYMAFGVYTVHWKADCPGPHDRMLWSHACRHGCKLAGMAAADAAASWHPKALSANVLQARCGHTLINCTTCIQASTCVYSTMWVVMCTVMGTTPKKPNISFMLICVWEMCYDTMTSRLVAQHPWQPRAWCLVRPQGWLSEETNKKQQAPWLVKWCHTC